jgi:hypothetical protein
VKGALGGARIRKISLGLGPRHLDDKELRLMQLAIEIASNMNGDYVWWIDEKLPLAPYI